MFINFERVKTYTLLLLVIMSLILVGILWEYQSPWLPTSFLSKPAASQKVNQSRIEASAKRDFFSPERIVYSLGFSTGYRVIEKDSSYYQKLWDHSKKYISSILSSNNINGQPQKLKLEEWSRIFDSQYQSFIVEFKTPIDKELLAWSLPCYVNSSCPIDNIYKIAVLPNEGPNAGINNDEMYVYVLTDSSLYEYSITKEDYSDIFKQIESDEDLNNYESMKWLLDREPKSKSGGSNDSGLYFVVTVGKEPKYKVRSDMIIPSAGRKESIKPIKSIKSEQPAFLKKKENEIAEEILKNESNSYDFDVFKDVNIIEFRNSDNIYRINSDGVLQYQSLANGKDEVKGNIVSAFQNTIQFAEGLKHLTPGAELSLTEITQDDKDQCYEFKFDYKINGMRSYVDCKLQGYEDKQLNHSLVIKANSSRVMYCLWLLRRFENSEEKPYITSFIDITSNLAEKLGTDYNNNFTLNDIELCYDINPGSQLRLPVWVVTINNKKGVPIGMEQAK